MTLKQALPLAGLLLCLVSACAEKADEPQGPAPASDAAATDPAPSEATVTGIPEAAHLALAQVTHEDLTSHLTGGTCRIENIVTVVDESSAATDSPVYYVVGRELGYRIVGFVLDKDAATVPARVDMVLTGLDSYSVPVRTGRPRGDVAEYFDNPDFAESGFLEDIAFARVAPGDYAVYFVDPTTGAACSTNQSIAVE